VNFTKIFVFNLSLLIIYPLFAVAGDPVQPLQSQPQKENYSIGYQVGLSMKKDGIPVEFDSFVQGLRDATNAANPLLSQSEMKDLLSELSKKARETQMRKRQETIVKNAEEAKIFLDENGHKEGIKTTESGLQYKILKAGDGPSPGPEDFVKVHYRGTLLDGSEFDSSYAKGEPQTVQTDGVIKGWTEALQMMKVNSKWQLFIPPDLAYGRTGLDPKIPPNAVLIFEIELLSIEKEKG
jgi:FKBP-type peptidyl-prolyl cis-trans isomerase FklB